MEFTLKYYRQDRLILLIIILYLVIEAIVQALLFFLAEQDLSYYRFTPTALLIVIIFGIGNRYLHKAPWLWNLLIRVPFIEGTYSGNVYFDYQGEKFKKCRLVVKQTTFSIKINGFFWDEDKSGKVILSSKTESESLIEDFRSKENQLYELKFYYQQKGNSNSEIPMREGFATLTYKNFESIKRLEGAYFAKNSKSKGNGGELSVDFKSKELNYLSNGK